MNDLLKVVANPNTVFYKKIVDVIFEQSPAIHKDFSDWNLIYNSSHEFFINLIGQRLGNYFRALGVYPVKTPIFSIDPSKKSSTSQSSGYGLYEYDPRVPYLNRQGQIEYLKLNPRFDFKEFVKTLNSKFIQF